MSKVTDNGGDFWLPDHFLTDDDIRMAGSGLSRDVYASNQPPAHFPTAVDSFRTLDYTTISPRESLFSPTGTESDGEETIDLLTRKISSCSLQDDLRVFRHGNNKKWDCMEKPSRGGGLSGFQKCNFPVASSQPPLVGVINQSDAALDILYEAAKDLARMRLLQEASGYYENRGLMNRGHGFRPSSDFGAGFNVYKQRQLSQFMQMQRHQQMMKQQENGVWGRNDKVGGDGVYPYNTQNRNPLSETAWPSLHQAKQNPPPQQSGSGMRAIFLGNTGAKRECSGTGVFLPRHAGSAANTRKKPGCSTVLLPDRVVQALNLNLETMESKTHNQSHPENISIPDHYGGYLGEVQKTSISSSSSSSSSITGKTMVNQEIGLPKEWIYG